jgi:hypothetical protein
MDTDSILAHWILDLPPLPTQEGMHATKPTQEGKQWGSWLLALTHGSYAKVQP